MPKAKIINVEMVPDFNQDVDLKTFENKFTKWYLGKVQQAVDEGCDTIVAIMLIDGVLQPRIDFFTEGNFNIRDESKKLGIKKIILVSGHGEKYYKSLAFDEIHYIDYTLRFTYNTFREQIAKNKMPMFDKDSANLLFLGGVPARSNRIGLLYKLYERRLLEDAIWSFFPPWTEPDQKKCRDILGFLNDDEYTNFINFADKRIDDRYENSKKYFGDESHNLDFNWHDIVDNSSFIPSPAEIDSKIFENTTLSIISEGPNYWFDEGNDFVTEKFWRTVFHKHPFVLAADPGQFSYMKRLGFKTFENYLLDQNYALHKNEETRLNKLVENVEYFLKNYSINYDSIVGDVEFNYNLALDYLLQQDILLNKLTTEYGVPRKEVLYYFDRKGYDHIIQRPV